MRSKWIKFEVQQYGKLTNIWVVSTLKDLPLGNVKWYAPWRKYCFFPVAGTVYAPSYLADIASFIDDEMKARKAKP